MRWLLWRARQPYVRAWGDRPLLVLPGVLDPVATKVGAWLAERVAAEALPGQRWVDMGCGTGIVGLALAAAGAEVTCVDIDPRCDHNARANAALLGHSIECVESDLFTALHGRRFDRVAYNVPFWPGSGEGRPFARAMYAGEDHEAIRRFAEAFRSCCDEARVVLGECGGDFVRARAALGEARPMERAHVRGEWLDLFAL